jgi:hypothetical protein
MNRCSKTLKAIIFIASCALLALAGTIFHSDAWAGRRFPPKAQRGEIKFVAIPDVVIDGVPERAAHGLRIHDERNATVVYGRVNGRTAIVNYLRNTNGAVREVWILTPEEIAAPPPPPPAATGPVTAQPLPFTTGN